MECTKHPDQDSLVTCFECGKSFCRICDPPEGAGQLCPACFANAVAKFTPQKPKPKPEKAKRVKEKASNISAKARESASAAASLPKKTAVGVRHYLKGRFPVALVDKERLETLPPLSEIWYKLLSFVLGGVVLWVLVAYLVRQRNPLTSMAVAAGVAIGVVWTFGNKNDMRLGILAVLLVLLTLAMGEITIQILFRTGLVTKMDLTPITLYSLSRPGAVWGSFLFKLIIWRMLPSVTIAFLIGLWPLPKRLSWKGFGK